MPPFFLHVVQDHPGRRGRQRWHRLGARAPHGASTWRPGPGDHLHAINKRMLPEIHHKTGDVTPKYLKVLTSFALRILCESSSDSHFANADGRRVHGIAAGDLAAPPVVLVTTSPAGDGNCAIIRALVATSPAFAAGDRAGRAWLGRIAQAARPLDVRGLRRTTSASPNHLALLRCR